MDAQGKAAGLGFDRLQASSGQDEKCIEHSSYIWLKMDDQRFAGIRRIGQPETQNIVHQ